MLWTLKKSTPHAASPPFLSRGTLRVDPVGLPSNSSPQADPVSISRTHTPLAESLSILNKDSLHVGSGRMLSKTNLFRSDFVVVGRR